MTSLTPVEFTLILAFSILLCLNLFTLWALARLEREVDDFRFDLATTNWSPPNQEPPCSPEN